MAGQPTRPEVVGLIFQGLFTHPYKVGPKLSWTYGRYNLSCEVKLKLT